MTQPLDELLEQQLGPVMGPVVQALGDYILRGMQGAANQGEEWIDQFRSPLKLPGQKSSRRHCALVRRRLAAGLDGARISPDGKQFFLTPQALAEECRPAPGGPAALAKTSPSEGDDGYDGMMRLIRGGGK